MPMSPHHLPSHPRILLVKLSSFGDVLHALPTLEALRAAYPRAHITWLVEAAYAPLLSGHPALDEVWVAPRLRPAEFFSGSNPATLDAGSSSNSAPAPSTWWWTSRACSRAPCGWPWPEVPARWAMIRPGS